MQAEFSQKANTLVRITTNFIQCLTLNDKANKEKKRTYGAFRFVGAHAQN